MKTVGTTPIRKEGHLKVTGKSLYVDDLWMEGMIHGVTVRSSVPRANIKKIHFEEGIPWNEFCIVTAHDIPGSNYVALIEKDQPFLADKVINHPEEAIVLLAHPDKYLLEKARHHVRIEVELLPPIFNIQDSKNKKEVVWGSDNVFKTILIEKGHPENIWAQADLVFEAEYETEAQEQLYIENQGMIAVANPDQGVTVWGSLQCPYYIHKALKPLFDFPDDKVRVIQTETGGGFGGKEEYPSLLAGHAALLAWKSGRPVKMIYSRSEDMAATTKRHPSRTKIKTAVRKDGKLLANEIHFDLDGGAYMTLSPVVLSRGAIHAAGPYAVEHVRVSAHAYATNMPPHGAFRGFGAPQSIFAFERHLDEIAEKLNLDPIEIRRKNFVKKGATTATGQLIREDVNFEELLDRALHLSEFEKKRTLYKKENTSSHIKRGVGLATFMHGAGFTGSGEKHLASVVGLEAEKDGKVHVLAASTEIGQGTNTIFTQIAADALKIPYAWVEIVRPDTARVPDSGPTVASRTCMVVGGLVQKAAQDMIEILQASRFLETHYTPEDFQTACKQYVENIGPLKTLSQYTPPSTVQWDDKHYRGDAYATYAWAVYVADISIDTLTFETRVEDFVALQEVGKVIHPLLAKGQIEGGVAQAIGYAISEKVVWKNGAMINNQMTNYIMPTTEDFGSIRVEFEERNKEYGPFGAKGIGELPMDGPAPAILNAVQMATGIAIRKIPMMPEDLAQEMSLR